VKQNNAIQRVYIKEYRGSPLAVEVSLMKQGQFTEQEVDELSFFKTVSSLGLTLSTFEDAPITLNALETRNVFGDK